VKTNLRNGDRDNYRAPSAVLDVARAGTLATDRVQPEHRSADPSETYDTVTGQVKLGGVEPRRVHEWYLAVYVDAVEWVELPNTLGMSQYADGGVMGSKPYVASGRYIHIQRMSNHCRGCRYDPAQATDESACPFTTLYWDFLIRHRSRFERHPRAGPQWRNLSRLSTEKKEAIRQAADAVRGKCCA